MSYRHTLEAALESLHEIEDLIKTFPSDGNIPNIEIDLTLQKIRNIYELLLMMKKEERTGAVAAAAAEGRVAAAAVAADGEVAAAAADGKVAAAVAVAVEESVNKTATPSSTSTTHAPATAAATAAAPAAPPPQTLGDQFKGRTTLHESLHQAMGHEGETLAHAKPVTNLMAAIGINDRFTFIRELFNSDTNAFETTMGILNDASSFNDAYNHMIQHFEWDMDSESVQLLLDIIRRKFIKSRHE
ncbi:MAG: hypothetical protein JW830_08865 [Bacteroidales bacterium]|nr:hypothetical protein [Bacteroidales bacterium]